MCFCALMSRTERKKPKCVFWIFSHDRMVELLHRPPLQSPPHLSHTNTFWLYSIKLYNVLLVRYLSVQYVNVLLEYVSTDGQTSMGSADGYRRLLRMNPTDRLHLWPLSSGIAVTWRWTDSPEEIKHFHFNDLLLNYDLGGSSFVPRDGACRR